MIIPTSVPAALGRYTKAILVESKNGLMAVDPDDEVVGRALREDGQYGYSELNKLTGHINKKSKVLVVGAHIGSLAIPLSKSVQKVVAIEANPKTFDLLELNIRLNKVKNCTIHNVAANSKFEKIDFLMNTHNSGGSKRKPKISDEMYTYDNPEQISIDSAPLDDYLEGQIFDVIIMDIEGSEYFALQGMKRILADAEILIIEFIPHHLKNVSGISIARFSKLFDNFSTLTLTEKNLTVGKRDFSFVLNYLYENDISDDGLIFSK